VDVLKVTRKTRLDELTRPFCTGWNERESTLRKAGHALQGHKPEQISTHIEIRCERLSVFGVRVPFLIAITDASEFTAVEICRSVVTRALLRHISGLQDLEGSTLSRRAAEKMQVQRWQAEGAAGGSGVPLTDMLRTRDPAGTVAVAVTIDLTPFTP